MKRKAKIFYTELDDFWRKERKLEWLRDNPLSSIAFESISPDEKNNWINQTDNDFESLMPLINKQVKLRGNINTILRPKVSTTCVSGWVKRQKRKRPE